MYISSRIHIGAVAMDSWRARGRSAAFVRKGDLEGSVTGYYTICMALIVLGEASRSHIRTLSLVPGGRLDEFEKVGRRRPIGFDDAGMRELLATLGPSIRFTEVVGTRASMISVIIRHLNSGSVCALALGDHRFQYAHWRLAVGIEVKVNRAQRTPTAILVLDPAEQIGAIASWNGRLELISSPDRRHLHYRTGEGVIRVETLRWAFALRKRP